jgi:hypothetical protein
MTKQIINKNQLLADLKQFTGSEEVYFNPLFRKFKYTEGVKYLAKTANSYWILDFIFSNQTLSILKNNEFQTWKIKVIEGYKAEITVEDGNHNKLKSFKLDFTDFPLDEFTLWFVYDTLMLPSEY